MSDQASAASSTPPPPPPAETPAATTDRISLFVQAVEKPDLEVAIREAIANLTGTGSNALAILSDPKAVTDEDLIKALVETKPPGIPRGVFRSYLHLLRGTPAASAEATSSATGITSLSVLPTIPPDESFLEMLKIGGKLKVGTTEVLSAIRAAMADRLGLYDLPDEISRRMEQFADDQAEPVGASYFELRTLVLSRSYAEVLSVMNIKGPFVTDGRRNSFLKKMSALWPALQSFNAQLVGWQQALRASLEPNLMLGAMSAMAGGGAMGAAPVGLVMAQPDTAPLRDAAESVIDKINAAFGGLGIPIARALAYDATCIRQVLENTALPAALGMPNREQMIRSLGIAVSADVVRLERSLAQFALAVMELKNVTPGRDENLYLGALFQLGATIPWDKIDGGGPVREAKPTGLGDRRSKP